MSMAVWRPQCDSHRNTGFGNDLSGEFQGPASTCVSAAQPLVNDLRCQASGNFIRENSGGKKKTKPICRVRRCVHVHTQHTHMHTCMTITAQNPGKPPYSTTPALAAHWLRNPWLFPVLKEELLFSFEEVFLDTQNPPGFLGA